MVALLSATMGWSADGDHAGYLDWKHRRGPLGSSFAWLAVDGDRVVGFRAFVRWQFEHEGRLLAAARAVDTATHPHYQGRGIFSTLTLHGLSEMAAEGVSFVFNTPNDRSRPGYLKMGWRTVGRLPVSGRPRSLRACIPLARARVPAAKWSIPTTVGEPAGDVLAATREVADLLVALPATPGVLRTHRSPAFLAWRYGYAPLCYRAMLLTGSVADGIALFRLRRRGQATEATICDVLVPDADPRRVRRLMAMILRRSRAEVAVHLGPALRTGSLPLVGQGPTLVWRDVCESSMPGLRQWSLSMGDVELL